MTEDGGCAWIFGDDINTDQLAPGLYLKRPIEEISRHCLETVDPNFAAGAARGDIIVAGRNFGLGSSREQAAEVLRHLGIRAVIAESFGGIFYRNALNFGLYAMACPDALSIKAGDRISTDPEKGTIHNLTRGETYASTPLPSELLKIVQAGGLLPFLEKMTRNEP